MINEWGCDLINFLFILKSNFGLGRYNLPLIWWSQPLSSSIYLLLSSIANCFHLLVTIKLMKCHLSLKLLNLKNIYSSNEHKLARTHTYTHAPPINNMSSNSDLIIDSNFNASFSSMWSIIHFPIFLPLWIHQTEQMHKENKHYISFHQYLIIIQPIETEIEKKNHKVDIISRLKWKTTNWNW